MPSGFGYADIVYLPKKFSNMPIMIIELKWNKEVNGAIQQIEERNYPQVFEGYGSDILLVKINYNETTKKYEYIIEKFCKCNDQNQSAYNQNLDFILIK